MTKMKLSFVGTALLLAWGALHAAEPAGKILVLQGTATASRAGKEVKLEQGSAVESGDVVRVGDTSSLQIRFTDESIVALRANTVFNIENYRFTPQEKTGNSIFSLVKGGMRTITGLIGKSNPNSYAVKASTATIGIRGTHFTVVNCASDCFNTDGSKSEDGLFGSVTDGRIVVRNNAGETEFGRDQFFVVRSIDTSPQTLLSPPAFLRDKLDGQARAKGNGSSAASNTTQTNRQAVTGSGTPGQSPTAPSESTIIAAAPTFATNSQALSSTTYAPASSPTVQTSTTETPPPSSGGTPPPNPPPSGGETPTPNPTTPSSSSYALAEAVTGTWTYTGPNYNDSGSSAWSWADWGSFTKIPEEFDDLPSTGYTSLVEFLKQPASWTDSGSYLDSAGQTVTYTVNETKTASTDAGFSAEAGNVYWGRFSASGTYTASDGSEETWQNFEHWAIGDPVTALPTAGLFTYVPAGGTSPTDAYGNVGTMSTHGRWTVDFGTKTIQTTVPIAWSMPNGTAYSVSVPSQVFTVNTQTYTDAAGVSIGSYTTINNAVGDTSSGLSNTTTCTGCAAAHSNVSVTVFGAQAQGLGAAVATNATLPNNTTQDMATVQVYKR